MVNVGGKAETARVAVADAEVHLGPSAIRAIRRQAVAKGDPLQTARLAGVLAAKRTADLIPLCHQIPLTHVDVALEARRYGYLVVARAETMARTGVEMEALVAAAVAALTLYDMLKAVDHAITIGPIRLREKRGGRSGAYRRKP
jgi:cyclic pyranopterin phosphate synthase